MTYAFPHNTVVVDKEGGIIENHRGMELRDYFAAQALSGLINYSPEPDEHKAIAELCYSLADAMMVAREK